MAPHENTVKVRQTIVEACSSLLYQKGFSEMSFSDMARASGVPRGNFYYHFKSKEQILQAVIDHRLKKMEALVSGWDEMFSSPLQKLQRFASIPLVDKNEVVRFGCPIGSLNTELAKSHSILQKTARRQFDFFKNWLGGQFSQMRPDLDGDALAMQLLIKGQGLSVMSAAYADSSLIEQEVNRTKLWLQNLAVEN